MPTMSDEDAVEAPPETKPDADDDPSPPATGTTSRPSTGTGNDEEEDEMLEGFPSTGSITDLTDDVGDAVAAVSEEAADGGGDNAPSEDQPPQSHDMKLY